MASTTQHTEQSSANLPVRSVDEPNTIPPEPVKNVGTSEIQFPIAHKLYKTNRDNRKSKSSRKVVKLDLYERWGWLLFDTCKLESKLKLRLRANDNQESPCYTYDEVTRYETNNFYRNCLVGSVIGSSLYLIVLFLLIIPETQSKVEAFNNTSSSLISIMALILAIALADGIRIGLAKYINAYILSVFNSIILILSILGNYNMECGPSDQMVSNAGIAHLPLALISMIEGICGIETIALRKAMFHLRCDQMILRSGALNQLSDVVNVIFCIRLLFL